ncbi:MAG: hypothetical protein R2724_15670 [Bryobacterales bacterium]
MLVEHLAEKGAGYHGLEQRERIRLDPRSPSPRLPFGNFKPSAVTVEALVKVMQAAGVPILAGHRQQDQRNLAAYHWLNFWPP